MSAIRLEADNLELSLQIPAYVRYAKRTGQAAYIGKGENIWGNVCLLSYYVADR